MHRAWMHAGEHWAAWVAVLDLLAQDHAGGAGLVGDTCQGAAGKGETAGGLTGA